jgi:fluoride exporter
VQGETREARGAGLVAIAVGGASGAAMRFGLSEAFPTDPGTFPTTTLVENVVGCFLLGLVLTLLIERWRPIRHARPFLAIGLLGAFTTFSTFAVETDRLLDGGHRALALSYVVLSVLGGVGASFFGVVLARATPTSPARSS